MGGLHLQGGVVFGGMHVIGGNFHFRIKHWAWGLVVKTDLTPAWLKISEECLYLRLAGRGGRVNFMILLPHFLLPDLFP